MEASPLYLHLLHFALAENKEMKKMTEREILLCNIPALVFRIQTIKAIIWRNRRWQQRTTEGKFDTQEFIGLLVLEADKY